jgi:hypothetical protein
MREIYCRILGLVKGTALVLGLAVMLAGVFGAASTVLAADGKPFLLGKQNVARAVSTLVKRGTGPALSLKVGADQPPLAVNSPARVDNLNADSLDGLDSSALLGKTEKAADAEKLGGVAAGEYARRCQGGAVRGFAHVRAAANFPSTLTSLQWYDSHSCGGGGVVAKRRALGEYYVNFPNANTYHAAMASTEEPGYFASANQLNTENGVMYVVWVRDHTGQPADVPFNLAAF